MKMTLIGYGKMGKEVERLALERGHSIQGRFDIDSELKENDLAATDVAVHFARHDAVVPHVRTCGKAKKNIVIGTTAWQNDLEKVRSIVSETGIGLVYASNFSIGVQVFFRLAREAAKLIDKFAEYDVTIHEQHHKEKIDSPSGTALTAAGILLENIRRKRTILSEPPKGRIKPEDLQITSTRAGAIVGTHTITFDSAADTIELRHSAKNRTGLALGALMAAEWINGKHGLYTMEDVLEDIIG
jgi:4-hydroxy-tetrahydrodipicolinate reductase